MKPSVRTLFHVAVLAALASACGPMPEDEEIGGPPPAENARWWRGLTQWQRNRLILERAVLDVDRYVGEQCKQWVQLKVVPEASRGVARIPRTFPDPTGWSWEPGPYVARQDVTIRQVEPGWIVQMRRRLPSGGSSPHTAIVYLRTADGVWWLDSNFYAQSRPLVVTMHYESFAAFEAATCGASGCRYSVYLVHGG